MGAAEYIILAMLILGGTWVAAKVLSVVWRFIGPPVLSFVDYFFIVTSTSGAEDDGADASTNAGVLVPGQQHQAASELVSSFEAIKSYLTDHTLTDDEAIVILALIRRQDGNDLLSANKIREIVGGNEGRVKAHVAAHRKPRPRPKVAARIERPANGWGS